jgi:hypothetical protein
MRVPQVSERIKEAPAQALRGVFAGIGQLLLITDKLRNKAPADVPHARTPAASETAADATASGPAGQREEAEPARATPPAGSAATGSSATEPTAAAPAKPARVQAAKPAPTRDFDKTGNVRLIGDDVTTSAGEVASSAPATTAATTAAEDKREDSAPPPLPPKLPPPLPNYDELSIASLRARLRSLDVAQVRQLTEYERAHAGRADVIAMFERRIVKLEAEAELEAEA